MKRYYFYTLILTIAIACFCLRTNAQGIRVESKIDRITMPMGDQTTLHVIAHIQAKDEITFPLIADSIAGKVQIVKALKPDTSFDKNNLQAETITHNYTVTSFTPGTYTIPVYTLKTKSASYSTDSITFQVTPVSVDTTKAIYDIKQPLTVSYTLWDWLKDHWLWVVIPLAVILLIIGIVYYIKKRPQAVAETVPDLPIHTIALNKLYALRDKKLWQQDEVKVYYSELTDILREYLEKRYHITAHEQTTDEIFAGLKNKDLHKDVRNTLRQLLVLADLVKFAKEKPSPLENEQSMENAITFITLTRQEAKLPENKEGLAE
jgi:hypothetical protein